MDKKQIQIHCMQILNAHITNVTLSMADHGCLVFGLTVHISDGTGCTFGGYSIGHGYLGADTFEGSERGTASLMKIMDVVGVERWEDIKGHYIRVKVEKGCGGSIRAIGNIMKENWFTPEEFFKQAED